MEQHGWSKSLTTVGATRELPWEPYNNVDILHVTIKRIITSLL